PSATRGASSSAFPDRCRQNCCPLAGRGPKGQGKTGTRELDNRTVVEFNVVHYCTEMATVWAKLQAANVFVKENFRANTVWHIPATGSSAGDGSGCDGGCAGAGAGARFCGSDELDIRSGTGRAGRGRLLALPGSSSG
ncbi:unnamed protein product, partial [Phaeothamnion confervicola]